MSTLENFLKCDKCSPEDHVIIYEFDNTRNEIRFYPFVQTNNISVEFHKIRIAKKPSLNKEYINYLISCPLCGKFTNSYTNVPFDWNVFCGRDVGLNILSVEG